MILATEMPKPAIRILDIIAFVLTAAAAIIQGVGCSIPNWWTHESRDGQKLVVGIFWTSGCDIFGRCEQNILNISEDKEWLFMSRLFEVFGIILCFVAVVVHIIFLPTRNFNIRSVSIYALGAAGLFILSGAFVFASMYTDLNTDVNTDSGSQSLGPGFGICILSGILTILAAVVTGVATVKKGDDYYIHHNT